MPGIHIRDFGESQRNEDDKDSALTVPGSYWLCHKQRIFKFKLKYEKHSKYTSNHFQYEKEMLKIFRRIIKEQPTPGQQFNTSHLLVTYNHSTATRREKMFAMVKFNGKPDVTVYHLVFVLTIKIIRENPRPDARNYVNGKKTLQAEKKKPKTANKKIEESSESTLKVDELSSKNGDELSNQQMNPDHQKAANPPASFFGDLENLPLLERYLLDQHDQPAGTPEILQGPLNDMQETIDMPYQYLIERDIEKTKSIELNKINNKIPENESPKIDKPETIVSFLTNKESSIETMKKSVSSPGRLEATSPEVEKTKKNIPSPLTLEDVPPAVEKEIQSPVSSIKSPVEVQPPKTKEPTPSPRGHSIDPPTQQRSANITDLVMEGLMFTIRQDKDSLTVVEQKTKLEPDEVLENSEKIETTEGAKCLVNSSLLRIQNLITKIDKSSTKKFSNNNNNNNSFKNNILPSSFFGQNLSMNNVVDDNYLISPVEDVVKSVRKNSFLIEGIKPLAVEPMETDEEDSGMRIDDNQEEKKEEEEDEDIIPEIMTKNDEDFLSIMHDETNLLMDDCDFDDCTPENNPTPPATPTFSTSGVNKTPRIVSNEIVKFDLSALRPGQATKAGKLDGADENLEKEDDNQPGSLNEEGKLENGEKKKKEMPELDKIKKSDETKLENKDKEDPPPSTRRRESSRRLSAKRKLDSVNDEKVPNKEIEIEMWKFLQDMQHGARVVLNRLDLSGISKRKKYFA